MTTETLIFIRLSQATVLLPLILGIVKYRSLGMLQRILLVIVGCSFITEALALYIVYFTSDSNNWIIYHIYSAVLFVLMSSLYGHQFSKVINRRWFHFLSLLFVSFVIVNAAFLQSIKTINSNTIVAGNIIYIILSVAFFYHLLTKADSESARKQPMFWVNSGVLLYNSGALMLFLAVNYYLEVSQELLQVTWLVNAGLNLLQNVLFTIAMWWKEVK